MILARTIQGCGGAIFPLAFGIIRDEFPRERIAGAIALISGILGIGGGLGIILAGPILNALSYHWLFWIPCVVTHRLDDRDAGRDPRVAGPRAREHPLAGGDPAHRLARVAARRGQRGPELGLGFAEDARAAGARRRAGRRLGGGGGAGEAPARGHDDDAAARCLDDESDRAPRRVRDVQRLRPDPAVRAGPDLDRLRVRRDRDAGRLLPRPVDDRDDDLQPARRPPLRPLRLEGPARPRRRDHDALVRRARVVRLIPERSTSPPHCSASASGSPSRQWRT